MGRSGAFWIILYRSEDENGELQGGPMYVIKEGICTINKDGSITTNGKIECDAFNKKYNHLIPDGNYETVAGYIISEIGRIPNEGESLFLKIGQIIIKKSSSRRIDEIQIFPNKWRFK